MTFKPTSYRGRQPLQRVSRLFPALLIVSLILTACGNDPTPMTISQDPYGKIPNSFAQMLTNVPDDGQDRLEITYNNYAATFRVFGFDKPTRENFLKPSATGTSIVTATRNLNPSRVSGFYAFADSNLKNKVGWSLEDIQAEIYTGPPNGITVLRGGFDNAAIDKALTAASYKKQAANGGSMYNIRPDSQLDVTSEQLIPDALTNLNNVGVSQNYLTLSPVNSLASSSLALTANRDKTTKTLAQNPGFKAVGEAFGIETQSVVVTNRLSKDAAVVSQSPRLNTATPAVATAIAQTYGNGAKIPLPKLAAIGYSEPKQGEVTFLLANYYDTPEKAQKALPIIENALKNGTSFVNNQPYSSYWQVASAGVKGNLTVYTLKPAAGRNLIISRFFDTRDLPILYGNE